MTFQTMCALRVYLRRGDAAPPGLELPVDHVDVGVAEPTAKAS